MISRYIDPIKINGKMNVILKKIYFLYKNYKYGSEHPLISFSFYLKQISDIYFPEAIPVCGKQMSICFSNRALERVPLSSCIDRNE